MTPDAADKVGAEAAKAAAADLADLKADLEASVQSSSLRVQQLSEALEAKCSEVEALEAKCAVVEGLELRLAAAVAAAGGWEAKAGKLVSELEAQHARTEEVVSELRAQQAATGRVSEADAHWEAKAEALEARVAELVSELGAQQTATAVVVSKLDAQRAQADEALARVEELEQQLRDAASKHQAALAAATAPEVSRRNNACVNEDQMGLACVFSVAPWHQRCGDLLPPPKTIQSDGADGGSASKLAAELADVKRKLLSLAKKKAAEGAAAAKEAEARAGEMAAVSAALAQAQVGCRVGSRGEGPSERSVRCRQGGRGQGRRDDSSQVRGGGHQRVATPPCWVSLLLSGWGYLCRPRR